MQQYQEDIKKAQEQFEKDLRIHEIKGMQPEFFFSDIWLVAKDGGQNLCDVAKYFLERGYRLFLTQGDNLASNGWNGSLEDIPDIKDGNQCLIRVNVS